MNEPVQLSAPAKTEYLDAQEVLGGDPPASPPPAAPPPAAPPAPPTAPVVDKAQGAGGQTLDGDTLAKRLERERNKILTDTYGTAVPEEVERIKAQRAADAAELTRLKRVDEARKRSRESAEQRQQRLIQEKDAENLKLREELRQEREGHLVEKQDMVITTTAAKFVRPERLKYAARDLAEYIEELGKKDPAALKKFTPTRLEGWFKKYVEENPDFAVTTPAATPTAEEVAAAAAAAKPPEAPRQRTITTAKPPAQRKPAPVEGQGSTAKTPRPGLPNSMNKQELDAHYKERGMKRPY